MNTQKHFREEERGLRSSQPVLLQEAYLFLHVVVKSLGGVKMRVASSREGHQITVNLQEGLLTLLLLNNLFIHPSVHTVLLSSKRTDCSSNSELCCALNCFLLRSASNSRVERELEESPQKV
jgi:hypothetical protein